MIGNIYFAQSNWTPEAYNPFTMDGSYGMDWSAFIYDVAVDGYSNVRNNAKVYSLTVNPEADKANERLFDFIRYETSYNRKVIVRALSEIKELIFERLNSIDQGEHRVIKSSVPRWLAHSTTKQAWEEIQKTGALLSPTYLRRQGKEVYEIGLKALLEPADYSDYIMLDVLNGCGELVVNSRHLGYVCIDPNVTYTPGVRLYFDAHKIIADGLGTRDGLHVLKVFERLPLEYMVLVINESMLSGQIWSPKTFTTEANNYFLARIKH